MEEDIKKLIYSCAKKFYGVEKEDLISAGYLGVQKALENYNKNSNTKFTTYAYLYIIGEMSLLANQKQLKVNKDILRMYKLIEKARYEESQKLGYIPSNNELSKIMNIDQNTIDFTCLSAATHVSFDADNEYSRNLNETIPYVESMSTDDRILLYSGLEMLPENEKIILEERYLKDETQSNVAKKLNMTQVMVSRLEKKGLTRMRQYIN